jgi:hypothetical protein
MLGSLTLPLEPRYASHIASVKRQSGHYIVFVIRYELILISWVILTKILLYLHLFSYIKDQFIKTTVHSFILVYLIVRVPVVHRPYLSGILKIGWRLSEEPQKGLPMMVFLPWDELLAQLLTSINKFSRRANNLTPCK